MKTFAVKRLGRREKLFLLIWAGALAAVAVKAGADRLSADMRALDAGIAAKEARLVKLTKLMTQADAINARYAAAMKRIRSPKDSGTLIEKIETIARKSGVNLVNLKPMQLKDAGQPVNALKVEIQDNLQSIAIFFDTVNRELSGIGVERVQIFTQNREEPPHAAFVITSAEETRE